MWRSGNLLELALATNPHQDVMHLNLFASNTSWRFEFQGKTIVIQVEDAAFSLLWRRSAWWEHRIWTSKCLKFASQLVCCSLDGHARAMPAEWEQSLLAQQALVMHSEICLGNRVAMANVQEAIHVRVREGRHEFVLAWTASIQLENLHLFPLSLHIFLKLLQKVSPFGVPFCAFGCHLHPLRCKTATLSRGRMSLPANTRKQVSAPL
mmetsp:Transcript_132905/g.230953  ORF Transcript_132905/g.230953 Transcript_132905/m.230953 type:complete len:208 (+) Transcript_132905:3404-4027(+)